MTPTGSQSLFSPAPVTTVVEARELASHYVEVMDTLIGLIQQETDLVKDGRLSQADKLAAPKADLARLYIADTIRLRANQAQIRELAPDLLEALVRRHDSFRALLQINLTVLATAHAVSEGIVRGVAGELTRKASPQTYAANGTANAPDRRMAQPLAVSRLL
jgi:hypothetical protein